MFRKLLSLDQARRLVMDHIGSVSLGDEQVDLLRGTGRVLAEDIIAETSIPPFDRSTVDGYAVKAKDTFGAAENRPVTLNVCGTVRIGEVPKLKVGDKQAAQIATGAPIPDGADAVVMVEDTERTAKKIRVFSAVANRGNVTVAGTDIHRGETVLKRGALIGSREVGVLAALGIGSVPTFRVPRVAVISTGPELVGPGKKLSPGRIFDINAYSLSSAVVESGGNPVNSGIVEDDFSELQEALRKALTSADIVVASGGASVGPKDLMPTAIASMGTPGIIFSGIAIKPGKPTTFAVIGTKPVFSLPGHPASALLIFHLLVRSAVQLMGGREPESDTEAEASAAARMFSAKGRRTFVMVKLRSSRPHGVVAEPVQGKESGTITLLTKADGYVEIPESVQFIDEGDRVSVHLFRYQGFCSTPRTFFS